MHISVWSHDSNPSIDPRSYRRSLAYCQDEIRAGRAQQIDPNDIRRGIQLCSGPVRPVSHVDHRGSPEARGCLTAAESHLQADYRRTRDRVLEAVGKGRACLLADPEITRLNREYEDRYDRHIAKGMKGTPRMCAVIAARVKTLPSNPAIGRKVVTA